MADVSVLTLPQGIDSGYAWPITEDGAPAVLTGYTVLCQVRAKAAPDAELLATLTASVTGSDATISWTAEASLAWTWKSGFADVILINASGRPVQIVWQGKVTVDKVVSHA